MWPKISIAIDGPAGAGKSTIAKLIAKKNSLTYVDTGAMYRAITLKILCQKVDINDEKSIKKILSETKIDVKDENIILDGILITDRIREPKIDKFVSYVSKEPLIRSKMVDLQRKIATDKNIIMDGRDIATSVLPDATYKFFLTASLEERAKRRFTELRKKHHEVAFEDVKKEIKSRDKIDTERKFAPLRKATDAITIDTTGKTIEDVVTEIQSYIDEGTTDFE